MRQGEEHRKSGRPLYSAYTARMSFGLGTVFVIGISIAITLYVVYLFIVDTHPLSEKYWYGFPAVFGLMIAYVAPTIAKRILI